MRAVDTNVLVRLATRDDTRQTAAAEDFVAGGAWVAHLALVEAMWVLASVYDLGSEKIAMALALRLKAAGYGATTTYDALTGLDAAVSNPPALVLLDISMPAGDGFSVAERIQKLIPTPTPIIFLTASKKPGFREKAKKLGAAEYFEKPYEAKELLGAIQQALA